MSQLKPIKTEAPAGINPLNEVILRTRNFQTIQHVCKTATEYKRFIGLVGEAGYGKTIGLKYYCENTPNATLFTASASLQSKIFWVNLLDKLGGANPKHGILYDYKNRPQYYIIESICEILNSTDNPLLIIDEAGKVSPRMLLDFHTLRDATNCGIVMAGPSYFKNNLEKWSAKQKQGIPELYSRINTWVELNKPTAFELKKICESRGVSEPEEIKGLIYGSTEFRTLSSKITDYLINHST